MRMRRTIALLLTCAALAPMAARAQGPAASAPPAAAALRTAAEGPARAPAPGIPAVRWLSPDTLGLAPLRLAGDTLLTPLPALRHRGEASTLMIVGAAGVVAGLVTGQGLITFGGCVVGLYGLYLYLR